jgi:hypothetical protein
VPSHLHEALLLLFRNRPELAAELLHGALSVQLPAYTEARIESADLTDIQPAEYRADLVVLLYDQQPVMGVVVEAQLARDEDKPFTWPMYVTGLRARIRCPVCLLVVTADESVAKWAGRTVQIGGLHAFTPYVLGPSGVPVVIDHAQAQADPELAVLSAMAHGRDPDITQTLEIALAAIAASAGLDASRSTLYFDLVVTSLGETARQALRNMDPAKYEYQSEFAKRFLSQGKAEGKADAVLKQLALRFGPLPETAQERVRSANAAQLDALVELVLTAKSLDDALAIL